MAGFSGGYQSAVTSQERLQQLASPQITFDETVAKGQQSTSLVVAGCLKDSRTFRLETEVASRLNRYSWWMAPSNAKLQTPPVNGHAVENATHLSQAAGSG